MVELNRIKALPKIRDNHRHVHAFANTISNSVVVIKGLSRPQNLCSLVLMTDVVEKMPFTMRYHCYDYSPGTDEGECCDITVAVKFLSWELYRRSGYTMLEGIKIFQWQATHTTREEQVHKRELFQHIQTCPQCQRRHILVDCKHFLNMAIQER